MWADRGCLKLSGMSTSAFRLEKLEGSLWSLVFDTPGEKVNKLNEPVMKELAGLLPELRKRGESGEIEALIFRSGKDGQFIAGADITMIQAAQSSEGSESAARTLSASGQGLMNEWEDLPFPTIAAVQGPALGGGCEWTLACSAILMSNDSATKIGLPEVMLGLLPGMGGCVRLPRKIGLAGALDMILSSRQIKAEQALKMGLIEGTVTAEQFLPGVIAWTKKNLEALKSGRRLAREPRLGGMGGAMGSVLESAVGRGIVFGKARDGVMSKTRGKYPAPLEVIQVIRSGGVGYGEGKLRGDKRDRALAIEAAGFGRLAASDVSRSLINLFFLTEVVKKSKGVEGGRGPASIHQAAVLGAGVMGGGIAQLFADRGTPTRMKDLTPQALTTGVQQASSIWAKQLSRKRITPRQYQQKLNLIAPTLDYSGFGSADLVVEAVVEKMEIKRSVFKELEGVVRDDCVIASNTSSLSVSEMQKGMKHPERFAGMHFFNPVNKMPLVEVIQGAESSPEAVATVYDYCKKVGKTPIVVKDVPGFLVNRLLMPYLNEATYLVADGVPIDELDAVILDFGMPMGPMELIDEVGIDVGDKVSHILNDAYGARMKACTLNANLVSTGRLGKKNGRGLYVYEKGGKERKLDPEIYSILGVKPRKGVVSEQEMVERCILPMINEASRALAEGVVATPGEVDLGMIMGTGFPPFRGGLLRYADTLGARHIVERLTHHSKTLGARFEPSPRLLEMAEHNRSFY